MTTSTSPKPDLSGRKVAFLVANEGIEQAELTEPWQAVKDAGGQPVLIAPQGGTVRAFDHLDKADTFEVDQTVEDSSVQDFVGLVLPGGVANPDTLRTEPAAVALVTAFTAAGLPVAAVCHAPWTLIEADLVKGRELTSWPSLKTDIINAGGRWVDQEVVVSTDGGWTLITSRNPGDLPAFCAAALEAFAG